MALPEECVDATQTVCMESGMTLTIQVLSSAAGYYIGFMCPECGPYSRESGYFRDREQAETAFDLGGFGRP